MSPLPPHDIDELSAAFIDEIIRKIALKFQLPWALLRWHVVPSSEISPYLVAGRFDVATDELPRILVSNEAFVVGARRVHPIGRATFDNTVDSIPLMTAREVARLLVMYTDRFVKGGRGVFARALADYFDVADAGYDTFNQSGKLAQLQQAVRPHVWKLAENAWKDVKKHLDSMSPREQEAFAKEYKKRPAELLFGDPQDARSDDEVLRDYAIDAFAGTLVADLLAAHLTDVPFPDPNLVRVIGETALGQIGAEGRQTEADRVAVTRWMLAQSLPIPEVIWLIENRPSLGLYHLHNTNIPADNAGWAAMRNRAIESLAALGLDYAAVDPTADGGDEALRLAVPRANANHGPLTFYTPASIPLRPFASDAEGVPMFGSGTQASKSERVWEIDIDRSGFLAGIRVRRGDASEPFVGLPAGTVGPVNLNTEAGRLLLIRALLRSATGDADSVGDKAIEPIADALQESIGSRVRVTETDLHDWYLQNVATAAQTRFAGEYLGIELVDDASGGRTVRVFRRTPTGTQHVVDLAGQVPAETGEGVALPEEVREAIINAAIDLIAWTPNPETLNRLRKQLATDSEDPKTYERLIALGPLAASPGTPQALIAPKVEVANQGEVENHDAARIPSESTRAKLIAATGRAIGMEVAHQTLTAALITMLDGGIFVPGSDRRNLTPDDRLREQIVGVLENASKQATANVERFVKSDPDLARLDDQAFGEVTQVAYRTAEAAVGRQVSMWRQDLGPALTASTGLSGIVRDVSGVLRAWSPADRVADGRAATDDRVAADSAATDRAAEDRRLRATRVDEINRATETTRATESDRAGTDRVTETDRAETDRAPQGQAPDSGEQPQAPSTKPVLGRAPVRQAGSTLVPSVARQPARWVTRTPASPAQPATPQTLSKGSAHEG